MPEFQKFKAEKMPPFKTLDLAALQGLGTTYDKEAYLASDRDFAQRHRPLLKAERKFEKSVLADQIGESELMPEVQNEFMRAGLTNALTSFGDTPGTLAPGSAGEASVARNLGVNILNFQDRNRSNRQRSLTLAESLFPRRSFGLSGADAAGISVANTAGQNNWNQADWATQLQLDQLNYGNQQQSGNSDILQGNADAAAEAQKKQAAIAAGTAILSAAVMAAAMSCWVAREVYGVDNPAWRVFRRWMLLDAPWWFRDFYLSQGEKLARALRGRDLAKAVVRKLFDLIVRAKRKAWD